MNERADDARRLEATAALLERAYRMALLLQDQCRQRAKADDEAGFAACMLTAELVALLDDARAGLLGTAVRTP